MMMMMKTKPINVVDIILPPEACLDVSYDTAIWWLISVGIIYYLADTLINSVDIVSQFASLLQETSLEAAVNKAGSLDLTSLNTNNFTSIKTDLLVNLRLDINSIQLIIFHAKEQFIILATVNPDFTLTIHEQAIVNGTTTATELNNLQDRFLNSFYTIIDSQTQPVSIQTTIITKADLEFWYKSEPFIPILEILTEYPFHLFAYMYDLPSFNLQLQNVGTDIFALEVFENNLIHQNGLLNNLMTITESTNLDRQPLWSYYQAHGQLWRYIVTIRNAYIVIG